MSVRVTINQLQEHLPDLLDQAVESGEECIIQRDGKDYAVLISAREWERRGQPADGLSALPLSADEQERRLQEIGEKLDALGPDYRLAVDKQTRAEELLAKEGNLTGTERRELQTLLDEADAIMVRRAEALARLE